MVVSPEENLGLANFLQLYLRNNVERRQEADYYPARLFSQASRWVWDNSAEIAAGQHVLMVVDSFDPHEPWDPPAYYRRLYDQDETAVDVIQSLYGPYAGQLEPREVKRMQANYAGEVTMVDRWFGSFIETLRSTGLLDTSIVAVISDHGHNIGHEPGDKGLISKQGHPMTHAVADLVLMMRHPEGQGAGATYDGLVYNLDLTSTIFGLTGVQPWKPLDGFNFWPKVLAGDERAREHVTVGWGPLVTVITDEWWYNANIWGEGELLYRDTGAAVPYYDYTYDGVMRSVEDSLRRTGLDFSCAIVGSGECEQDLRSLAAQLGLQQQVQFLGSRPQREVIEIVQSAAVMAASSASSRSNSG